MEDSMITSQSEFSDSSPKYRQIADATISDIKSGILEVGRTLPSVRKYASDLGISSTTVSRAYKMLESQGYIETKAGEGSVVSFLKGGVGAPATTWKAFLSYARRDDENSHGAITELKQHIQEEYEMQTAERLDIFQDTEGIECGEDWRKAVGKQLGATVFFIPILTPTYLRRPHCIQELREARWRFSDLGLDRGIYPIHFVDITDCTEELEDDDLAGFITHTQANCDWRDLRFESSSSPAYRKGIKKIVEALVKRDKEMLSTQQKLTDPAETPINQITTDEDDVDLLQKIADLESAGQQITEKAENISEVVVSIGNIFTENQIPSDAPFKNRLIILKKIGKDLEQPAIALSEQCNGYRKLLEVMDRGIEQFPTVVELTRSMGGDVDSADLLNFRKQISDLNKSTSTAFEQIQILQGALATAASLSRDLRQPCRKISAALDDVTASKMSFAKWEKITNELIQA
jgi:DNA-binding transcriptional regulator YhcF (GntR family)